MQNKDTKSGQIRKLLFEDLLSVYFIEQQYFPDNLKLNHSIINHIHDPEFSFIYEFDGRIAGFIRAERDGKDVIIHTVCVESEYSSRGIGRMLLECCIKEIGKNFNIFLMVSEKNQVAKRLYESVGFRVKRTEKNAYLDGSIGFIMKLD